MFSYFAYGLGIKSTLSLPEFAVAERECDVMITQKRNGGMPYSYSEASGKPQFHKVTPEETVFSFKYMGVFQVCRGREINIFPILDAETRLIQLVISGTAMAILLFQRGLLVLHASAVEVDGGVVVFLAQSG
jgi:hypothetical protein